MPLYGLTGRARATCLPESRLMMCVLWTGWVYRQVHPMTHTCEQWDERGMQDGADSVVLRQHNAVLAGLQQEQA